MPLSHQPDNMGKIVKETHQLQRLSRRNCSTHNTTYRVSAELSPPDQKTTAPSLGGLHPKRHQTRLLLHQRKKPSLCFYWTVGLTLLVLFQTNIPVPGAMAMYCSQFTECNRTLCALPEECVGGLAVEPCGCCKECAKVVGEVCGGEFGLQGRCDQGLYCAINPEAGVTITGLEEGLCKAIPVTEQSCDQAQCNLAIERPCPEDSISLGGDIPNGECCPLPFRCECMPCLPKPVCEPSEMDILLEIGIGQPGQCCDVYECRVKEEVCADVMCEEDPFANATCPEDSMALVPLATQGGCCQQQAGCLCQPPDNCEIPECEPDTHLQLVSPRTGQPGRCCDKLQCVSDASTHCPAGEETWHEDGSSWNIDACTQCQCRSGLTRCDKVQCPSLEHCGWISIPEGECCHQCMGCTVSSNSYPNGAEWQQDSCVTCYCEEGQVFCRAESCQAFCANPRHSPGICCPVCDEELSTFADYPSGCPELENCTVSPDTCPLGFEIDEMGCDICQCREPVNFGGPSWCKLICPLGYILDEDGLKICECRLTRLEMESTTAVQTLSLDEDYYITTTPQVLEYRPPDVDIFVDTLPCESMVNCDKECMFGFRVSREGCPRCRCNRCPPFICQKKCLHGYAYNDNGCVLCKCRDNATQQEYPTDTDIPLFDPGTEGTCLTDDGRLWEDGQSWHDSCRRCFCHQGIEMCTMITCPVLRCRNPVVFIGDCCASCPHDMILSVPSVATRCQADGGRHVAEGETWTVERCTLCICHNGEMLCEVQRCPPLTCHRPVKLPDQCCPVCIGDEELYPVSTPNPPRQKCEVSPGMVFRVGDIWRVSACQSCMCRETGIHCFSQTCPLLSKCNKTIMRKGQCCPQCIEDESGPVVCNLAGETYASGEMWLLNNCTWCVCHNSRILCLETQCNPLSNCPAPVTLPDSCCPICPNQTLARVHKDDGYTPDAELPPEEPYLTSLLIAIIILVVTILLLLLAIGLICWYKKRQQQRQRCQHARVMQAMFQQQTTRSNVSRRPKSVNLEYRSHYSHTVEQNNQRNRFDYPPPPEHKYTYYDETEGLLTAKSKLSDSEAVSVDNQVQPDLVKEPPRPDPVKEVDMEKGTALNDFNQLSQLENNYNINFSSDKPLAAAYSDSSNDLTGDLDKLSDFDNAACISSSCSDFDPIHPSRSKCTSLCSESEDRSPFDLGESGQTPEHSPLEERGLNSYQGDASVVCREHPQKVSKGSAADRHIQRYSINDEVWLRNSSHTSDHDKAPMGDKFIRYSMGAGDMSPEPDSQAHERPDIVCDNASYRKSF